ncbi:DUF58 domain-containing protein [Salinibius halmophilus]|uniref:DUF58 domain-containing protein n=1 Tax=Salinibius halmophilus TaxID=1853216 RepID=UPI000E67122C|nr:DUF58 domain-containing protein [Salinibius halmophilus]
MKRLNFVPSARQTWLWLACAVSVFLLELLALRPVALVLLSLVGLAALADLLAGWQLPSVSWHRQLPPTLIRGRQGEVSLTLVNESNSKWQVRLLDNLPNALLADVPVEQCELTQSQTFRYTVQPWQRGDYQLDKVYSQWASPLKLWWRARQDSVPATIRVVPNALATASQLPGIALRRAGALRQRRQGNGTEFLQLRDWQQGESARQIDWKASARRHRLIAKETEVERDQQLIFLLDTGPAMSYRDEHSSLLDHALDAALFIASDAMKHGDAVGVASSNLWIAPQAGRKGLVQIADQCSQLQTQESGSDLYSAAQTIVQHSRRGTMVIILTSGEQSSELLTSAQTLLEQNHHKVMMAALDNPELAGMIETADNMDDIRTALSLASDRRQQIDQLSQRSNLVHSDPKTFAVKLLAQWQVFRANAR